MVTSSAAFSRAYILMQFRLVSQYGSLIHVCCICNLFKLAFVTSSADHYDCVWISFRTIGLNQNSAEKRGKTRITDDGIKLGITCWHDVARICSLIRGKLMTIETVFLTFFSHTSWILLSANPVEVSKIPSRSRIEVLILEMNKIAVKFNSLQMRVKEREKWPTAIRCCIKRTFSKRRLSSPVRDLICKHFKEAEDRWIRRLRLSNLRVSFFSKCPLSNLSLGTVIIYYV